MVGYIRYRETRTFSLATIVAWRLEERRNLNGGANGGRRRGGGGPESHGTHEYICKHEPRSERRGEALAKYRTNSVAFLAFLADPSTDWVDSTRVAGICGGRDSYSLPPVHYPRARSFEKIRPGDIVASAIDQPDNSNDNSTCDGWRFSIQRFLTGFFSSSSKPIYHFHFQKLITDSPDSLAFVSLEEFIKFIDPFLSKRERRGAPSIRDKKFLRSSSFDGRKGKGGRGESLREGEGEKHASSHIQLFSNAVHAKDAKDCCRST